jgi:hypothetical protein
MGIILPALEMPFKDLPKTVRSSMNEVSTVVADAMREIARSFVGLFNFKKLFGAEIDTSAFDKLVDAANAAYDKITDAARRAFDAQELQISRAEQDEDIRYQRQYDRECKAIEDSSLTQKQKDAALLALEIKYENAKLARERAREDAKYAREEAQKVKLLALETAHQLDLDKIRDDRLKKEDSFWFKVKGIVATAFENIATVFLTKMFTPIMDGIAKLAGKLVGKGVDTVTGALGEAGKSTESLGKTIGDLISGIGKGIGGFISGLATGIAAAMVTIATAIGTVVVTLATAIAAAATILAAAAPAFIVVGLIAVGIFATIALLKRLILGAGGSGAGDGMGRVVERQDVQISLLTIIKDLTFNNRAILDDIKTTLWSISERFSTALGYLKDIAGATNSLSDSIDDLGHDFLVLGNNIDNGLIFLGNSFDKGLISLGNKIGKGLISVGKILDKGLISLGKIFDKVGKGGEVKGAQQIVRTVDHVPNIIMPLREYRTAAASVGVSGSNSNVNVTFNIRALDGTDMINVVRSKVVPILQNILNHNGLRVPTGAVGGA